MHLRRWAERSLQVRYTLRERDYTLRVIPARDRGLFRTDFTLQAFSPPSAILSFERISQELPFAQVLSKTLTRRNTGGHTGLPTWIDNPQYRLTVSPNPLANGKAIVRVLLSGERNMSWNVKLLWGRGEFVFKCVCPSESGISDLIVAKA